jgi:hypothetical protein
MKIQWETFYAICYRHYVKESQKLKTCGAGGGQKKTNTGLRIVYIAKFKYKLQKCDLCSYSTNGAHGQRVTYYVKESNSKNKMPLVTKTITITLILIPDVWGLR